MKQTEPLYSYKDKTIFMKVTEGVIPCLGKEVAAAFIGVLLSKIAETACVCFSGQDQRKGRTMRLGAHDAVIRDASKAGQEYKASCIHERSHHLYEVYSSDLSEIERDGLVFSSHASNQDTMQIMELENHTFFFAYPFHSELKFFLLNPTSIFLKLLKVADEQT